MSAALKFHDEAEKIGSLESTYDVFKYMKTLTDMIGFTKFTVLHGTDDIGQLSQIAAINNWDPELLQVYDGEKLAIGSPIIRHANTGLQPLNFEIEALPQDRADEKKCLSVTLFKDFGMDHGICIPTFSSTGARGAISFSGNEASDAVVNDPAIQCLASLAFDKIIGSKTDPKTAAIELSVRERECLTWTAAGKTSSEISDILDISDHTVNHYLTMAGRKLDAVNRVQTVAKAIRLGLLS